MTINNETAGDRVFDNVDDALAERIVSRALENGREPERAGGRIGTGRVDADKPRRRRSASIVKIAVPVALALIALWILARRRS